MPRSKKLHTNAASLIPGVRPTPDRAACLYTEPADGWWWEWARWQSSSLAQLALANPSSSNAICLAMKIPAGSERLQIGWRVFVKRPTPPLTIVLLAAPL